MTSSLILKYDVIIVILMSQQLKKWKVFIVSLFLDGSLHIQFCSFVFRGKVGTGTALDLNCVTEHGMGTYSMFHGNWTTFKFNRNQLGTVSAYVM